MKIAIFSMSLIMVLSVKGAAQTSSTSKSSTSSRSQKTELKNKNEKKLVNKPVSTVEFVREALAKAENLNAFMISMYPYLVPGDDIFIQKILKKNTHLSRYKKLPTLSSDKGLIYISSESSEITLRRDYDSNFEFDINGIKINFNSGYDAETRWRNISKISNEKQTSWISFLPVAFAVEGEGAPTISSLVLFSFLSRFVHFNSIVKTKLRVGKKQASIDKIWTISKNLKGLAAKMSCSTSLLMEISQKLAEINASTLECRRGEFSFELPAENNTSQKFVLSAGGHKLQLVDANGKQLLSFVKSTIIENSTNAAPDASWKVIRMKGARWVPSGVEDEQKNTTIEHVRELINFTNYTDFCGLCEKFLSKAIIEAVQMSEDETEALDANSKSPTPAASILESTPVPTNGQSLPEGQLPLHQTLPPKPQPPAQDQSKPAQDMGAPQMMDLPPDMK